MNPGSELALVGSFISGSHSSQSSVSPAFGSIHSTAVSSNLGLSSFLFSGHRTHPFTHSQHQPQTHHLTLKQTRPNHDELSNPPTPTPTPTTTTITNITIPNINSTKACEPSPYVNSSVLNLGFSRPLLKTSIPSCIRVSKCSTVSCSGGTSNARRSSPLTTAIHSSGCGPSNHPAGFLVPQTNLSGSEEMAQPRNSRRRHSHSISSATPSAYQHHQHPLPPSFLPVTKETGLSGRYNDSTIVLNYVPVIATPASVLGHSGHSLGSSAVTDQDVTRAPSGRVCTGSFIDSPLECCFRSPTAIDQMSQSMTETYSASLSIASCATTQVTPVGAEILAASGIEEKRSISTLVGGNSLSSLSAVAASIPATGLVSDAISVCPQVEKLVPVNVSQLHNNGDGLVNYTQVDFARTLALGEVNGDISGTEVATGHGHCHGNQEHSLHRGRGSTGPGHHHLQQHHRHQNAEGLSGMEISFSKTANSHAIANAAASACADSSITDVEYCSPLSSSPQALRHHHQQNHFQQQHHQMAIALVNGLAGKVNRSASVRKALSRMIGRGGPNSRKKAERSSIVSTDSAGNG
ncbi:unnamed protein product [Protopolystoma xenopodis]|uniref:Uncharacterized protein n=1 Tax=Protopolystoma xenopodis TaxID=117903 RepID=A0A448XMX7_9PLAT|nr:unnamed protein product [Protopolystoma xenopodis]